MYITWIGQAGLLFEINGKKIIVDPYLSDNVKNFEPKNYRRAPVDEAYLNIKPDVIVVTHNHLDHLDKETLKYYLTDSASCLVLAPNGSYQELRKFGGNSNFVMFNSGTHWTDGDVRFTAVSAEHSDPCAIGVVIDVNDKYYYVTGDTLYSERVISSLPRVDLEAVFLPVNGVGNNMNMNDAAQFASRLSAKHVVPVHIGMFDCLTADGFDCKNKLTPTLYKKFSI